MPELHDILAMSMLGSIIVLLLVDAIRSRIKHRDLTSKHLEMMIQLDTAKTELEKATVANVYDSDAFIKFLEVSRDQAFDYIDIVQKDIKEFMEASLSEDVIRVENSIKKLAGHLPVETSE
jgi:hypothetical protein